MRYKLLIIFLFICLLGLFFLSFRKNRFDYASLEIDGVMVECKYVLFADPIKVNRINLFKEHFENIDSVPQWVKFAQYGTFEKSIFFKDFPHDLYAKGYSARTALIEKKYANDILREKKRAESLTDLLDEKALFGKLNGILFIRNDNLQMVLFKYTYGTDDSPIRTGRMGVYNKGKVVVADSEIFNVDNEIIMRCFGADDEDLIKNLRESGHGLLELQSSPFSWELPSS